MNVAQGKIVASPESTQLCTQILKILKTNTGTGTGTVKSIETTNAVDSTLTLCSVGNRSRNSELPLSTLTSSVSRCSSGASTATDSGKSSCSLMVLDASVDSGIMVEFKDLELHKRLQQCQRILKSLERDQETYRRLRERLGKISDRKNRKTLAVKQEPFCNVCCAELNLTDPKCFVSCSTCNKAICRNIKCADWLPKTAQWECQLCYSTKTSLSQTSTWVADQMSFNQQKMVCPMRARSEIFIPINDFTDGNMQFESVSQIGLNSTSISAEQKVKIREYVEELVSNMLGGSLDKVAVGQLSKSENYLPGILNGARQRVDSGSNNYSDISETRLRQLISTIITETLRLPMLKSAASDLHLDHRAILPLTNGNAGEDRKSSYFETETYHDLLATAVLNRIIGKENDSRIISESTPDLRIGHKPEDLDQKYIVENQSRSTCSSVEPRSDLSYSDEDQQNNVRLMDSAYMLGRESALSDYIATHTVPLPDLSAAFTDDEDHASAGSSTLGGETWEDNWLFKKKHSSLDTSRLSTSSRMLVPAPKEDIRAQIGDQIADEVSDLSEMGSDSDDSPMDAIRKTSDPLNDRLLNKHLIGGANTKMVLDELMDASLLSKTENNKVELSVQITSQCSDTDTSKLKDNNQTVEGYPISGSIAEREYRKWNNAVEMPNNPYAPEALKRRISGSGNEPFIDLPTINSGKEDNPLAFLRETQNDNADENALLLLREQEKLRYSRDYYINNESGAQALPYSPQKTGPMENRDEPSVDNVIINEVNAHGRLNTASNVDAHQNNSHWKLSSPVRRSSSLKFINKRHSSPFSPSISPHYTSKYENIENVKGFDQVDEDSSSQRSWKISKANYGRLKHSHSYYGHRNAQSTMSLHSSASGVTSPTATLSSASNRSSLTNANILSQFEKQLLHKDLKRNSFRAITQTTKDFVINPLFEREQFYTANGNVDATSELMSDHITNHTEDPVDSGIDSCLNGFSELDAKHTSLLF